MDYLTNWKFWVILIAAVIFVMWIFFGGEEHEFIGLKALDPNVKSDKYVDPSRANYLKMVYQHGYDDMDNFLGINGNLHGESGDGVYGGEDLHREDMDTCPPTIDLDDSNPSFPVIQRSTPKFQPVNSPSVYNGNNRNLKPGFTPTKSSFQPSKNTPNRLFTPQLRTPLRTPLGLGLRPLTPLSTDPTRDMDVSVTLQDALVDCVNEKKNKAESRGEGICRKVLEDVYERKFPSTRPDFLKNPESGCNLELDGYCEELQIGFEYNGIQHYIYPNWAHRDKLSFDKQVRRDQYKIEACDQSGVYLISIPYTIPHNLIRDYIIYYLPENVQKRIDARERGENIVENPPGLSSTSVNI